MFLGVLAERFGRSVPFEEIRSYHLGDSFALAADELDEFMRLAHLPEALASVEPMPGAVEALADWRQRGYEVFVVTGRPPATLEDTLSWLDRHGMTYAEFHFLDKYSEYYSGRPAEGTLCLADLPGLDFCLAVEDFPGTAQHLADKVGVPVALFDRPWNRAVEARGEDCDEGGPLVRCRGWAEIVRRFPAP